MMRWAREVLASRLKRVTWKKPRSWIEADNLFFAHYGAYYPYNSRVYRAAKILQHMVYGGLDD